MAPGPPEGGLLLGRRAPCRLVRLHHTAVWCVTVTLQLGGPLPLGLLPALPAPGQRLQEEGDGGEQVTDSSQVKGTVIRLGVVVQKTWGQQEKKAELILYNQHLD